METFDGVVILATNLRSNLDEAFTRRLQFVVDFPFPDEAERFKIWNVLFPPGVPREADIDFKSLADRFRLTGGNIRNIIVSASFLAASHKVPVSTQHILHSLRREMQKMGRLIHDKDVVMSK
jgi:SpoVK/Ycf46/Vps4 family AAA+-type ATPase